jgi:hypothetical protein
VTLPDGVVLRGGVDGFVTATSTTERTISRLAGTGTDDLWLFGAHIPLLARVGGKVI